MKMSVHTEAGGLVERLRETHTCDGCGEYVGTHISDLLDEAADKLEELENDLSIAQGNTDAAIEDYNNTINALAVKDADAIAARKAASDNFASLASERAAHAETKRERDEHKRLKNELVLKAYSAMDGADDLVEALGRYGFPVSDAAEPALMEGGSREAQALHKAAKAFIAARRVREGGEANG